MTNYDRLYRAAGVRSTTLNNSDNDNHNDNHNDYHYEMNYMWPQPKRPGFFKSFNSIDDFVMQVKAPIIMPIICLSTTLHEAIRFVTNVLLCVPNLLLGDFGQARCCVMECASNFHHFFEGIFRAVIDTVWELTVLITRLVATCFYAVVAEDVAAELVEEPAGYPRDNYTSNDYGNDYRTYGLSSFNG